MHQRERVREREILKMRSGREREAGESGNVRVESNGKQ